MTPVGRRASGVIDKPGHKQGLLRIRVDTTVDTQPSKRPRVSSPRPVPDPRRQSPTHTILARAETSPRTDARSTPRGPRASTCRSPTQAAARTTPGAPDARDDFSRAGCAAPHPRATTNADAAPASHPPRCQARREGQRFHPGTLARERQELRDLNGQPYCRNARFLLRMASVPAGRTASKSASRIRSFPPLVATRQTKPPHRQIGVRSDRRGVK